MKNLGEDAICGQLTITGPDSTGEAITLKGFKQYKANLTPAASLTATAVEQTFTVDGLSADDTVLSVIPPSALPANLAIVGQRVTAANTLGITFINPTAGSLTAPTGQWKVRVLRS
jgi:hypothetical protein